MSHESRCESKRTGILYQKHIDSYTCTHAHACTRSRSHALTRVQTLACTHTYLVTFRQTDDTYSYIHTYIHTYTTFISDRRTNIRPMSHADRLTAYIHTYARTYVRTYIHSVCFTTCLSVRPIVCLLVHVCCLFACLPPYGRVFQPVCLSVCR